MIGYLRGKLVWKQPPRLLVDVGGVGYDVEVPISTFAALPAIGETLELRTHLAVREDTQVLYGFATEDERWLFRALIKVSGVGAKLALTILSGATVRGFVDIVRQEDATALARLPGIGKKTSQRLIVEMRDRVGDGSLATLAGGTAAPASASHAEREAYEALLSLGYKPAEAARMLERVGGEDLDSAELVRRALRATARKAGETERA
jgi:holliday junction DNA helicase RuvA